jgi:hypothetical protein
MLALMGALFDFNVQLETFRKTSNESYPNTQACLILSVSIFPQKMSKKGEALPMMVAIPQCGTVGVNSTFIRFPLSFICP